MSLPFTIQLLQTINRMPRSLILDFQVQQTQSQFQIQPNNSLKCQILYNISTRKTTTKCATHMDKNIILQIGHQINLNPITTTVTITINIDLYMFYALCLYIILNFIINYYYLQKQVES